MSEKALALVTEPANENKGQIQRAPNGRFAKGTCGGSGGPRPGSGRPPKPKDPTLLQELYDILDKSAPRALEKLTKFIESSDDKISLKACVAILSKVLPEQKLLKNWEQEGSLKREDVGEYREFLMWKIKQDLKPEEEEGEEGGSDE